MLSFKTKSDGTRLILGLVFAFVVAVGLIKFVEASRGPDSLSLVTDSEAVEWAPAFDPNRGLELDSDIQLRGIQIDETTRELEGLGRKLDEERKLLGTARVNQRSVPAWLSEVKSTISTTDIELVNAQESVAAAELKLARFQKSIARRIEKVEADAERARSRQIADAFEQIEVSRKQRNELRARIGAQSDNQEEILNSQRLRRAAQQAADELFSVTVENEWTAIAKARQEFEQRIRESQAVRQEALDRRADAVRRLAVLEKTLVESQVAVENLPASIASLEARLDLLKELKDSRQSALAAVKLEKEKWNRQYASFIAEKSESSRYVGDTHHRVSPYADSAVEISPTPTRRTSGGTATRSAERSVNFQTDRYHAEMVESSQLPFNWSLPPARASSASSGGVTYVRPYYRRDGTFVRGHTRRIGRR